jgi:hypothetical protein
MNSSPPLGKASGTTDAHIPIPRLPNTSSTLHSSNSRIIANASIAVPASVVVAEAEAIIEEDACIRAYQAVVPKRTVEEEEAEEREWDSIVSKPHVRNALRRMAAEARRQYYAGETEEGGFGLE